MAAKKPARPGTEVLVLTLPKCDYCVSAGYQPVRTARYDFLYRGGSWGYGCREHYYQYRMHKQLGIGMGQRLVLPSEVVNPA